MARRSGYFWSRNPQKMAALLHADVAGLQKQYQ